MSREWSLGGRVELRGNGIYLPGGEERFILIPLRSYGAIIEAMRDLVGDMAGGPLYYLGKKIGMGLLEELGSRLSGEPSLEATVEEASRLLEELGFGKVSIEKAEDGSIRITLVSPPSLAGMIKVAGRLKAVGSGGSRGFCHLERGMMAALLERALGRRVRVVEEAVSEAEGKPVCVLRTLTVA